MCFDPGSGLDPEFSGYRGQLVKQADATMLQYPWQYADRRQARRRPTSDYYVPRTDPAARR